MPFPKGRTVAGSDWTTAGGGAMGRVGPGVAYSGAVVVGRVKPDGKLGGGAVVVGSAAAIEALRASGVGALSARDARARTAVMRRGRRIEGRKVGDGTSGQDRGRPRAR
jgi:hypothetical protein